jgi:hypothetical protein
MKTKTFSFIDAQLQDFVRSDSDNKVVRIQAEDHGHANHIMFESDMCDRTNWTNTGVKTWCWEDME